MYKTPRLDKIRKNHKYNSHPQIEKEILNNSNQFNINENYKKCNITDDDKASKIHMKKNGTSSNMLHLINRKNENDRSIHFIYFKTIIFLYQKIISVTWTKHTRY